MFAYAGASTFPTIQADMRERDKFIYSAVIAITSECPPRYLHTADTSRVSVLFLIYFPVAVACYYSLGDLVQDNIVLSMSGGWERAVVEVMLLVHLVTTFPIIMNPPAQILEHLLRIPPHFNWRRCVFRWVCAVTAAADC